MKTLYLMRHGKSSWDTPADDDHDRPLTPRGIRASGQIGRILKAREAVIDLTLCSTARRAVDTAMLVVDICAPHTVFERERGLYLCGAATLLSRLRDVPDAANAVLLVAHNPDVHDLARLLYGAGSPEAMAELDKSYPTGALTVLLFENTRWRDIEAGGGRLVDFVQPRKLV